MSTARRVTGPQPLLPHAERLHGLGISVIPIKAGTKRSAVRWKGFQTRRANEETLRLWFGDADNDNLGIGVVLGEVSGGLLVRDFDDLGAYRTWVQNFPVVAQSLPTVETRRGFHVWFRCEGYRPRNGRTFCWKYADGELRGDGHLVVVPPTIHRGTGMPYRWSREPDSAIPLIDLRSIGILPPPSDVTHDVNVLHATCVALDLPSIIDRTLPAGPGQRNRCIFEFARHLKAQPDLASCSPRDLEPHLRLWHERASPFIRTKAFADTFQDFQRSWHYVKWPAGVGSLQAALKRATTLPIPEVAQQFRKPEARLLVSLCCELQRGQGHLPFFLSCRDAAKVLGLVERKPHVTAWRWLKRLCEVGILEAVKSGSFVGRKANEYRYLPRIAG